VFSVKTLDFETLGDESTSLYNRAKNPLGGKPSNVIKEKVILVKFLNE
jgi:hypothetical protein